MRKVIYCLMSILLAVGFASAQDLLDGLVAYYPLDGDANNQAADVGHGTVNGAVLTEDRNGNPNSAYLFNGVEDECIKILDTNLALPMGGEPRTLAAWARCDDLTMKDGHFMAYGTGGNEGEHCHLSLHALDGFVRMGFWYNDIDAYVDVFDSVWYHFAGIWDGNNVSLYFDGILQETLAPIYPVNTVPKETLYMTIGCINDGEYNNKFTGAIDEVMIFSRALDESEIAGIMDYNTQIDDENHMQVSSFKLYQNYPNPFNPTTQIYFSLSRPSHTTVQVFNTAGQHIKTLADHSFAEGTHTIHFQADDLSAGVYFYSIKAENFSDIKKMILLK